MSTRWDPEVVRAREPSRPRYRVVTNWVNVAVWVGATLIAWLVVIGAAVWAWWAW